MKKRHNFLWYILRDLWTKWRTCSSPLKTISCLNIFIEHLLCRLYTLSSDPAIAHVYRVASLYVQFIRLTFSLSERKRKPAFKSRAISITPSFDHSVNVIASFKVVLPFQTSCEWHFIPTKSCRWVARQTGSPQISIQVYPNGVFVLLLVGGEGMGAYKPYPLCAQYPYHAKQTIIRLYTINVETKWPRYFFLKCLCS